VLVVVEDETVHHLPDVVAACKKQRRSSDQGPILLFFKIVSLKNLAFRLQTKLNYANIVLFKEKGLFFWPKIGENRRKL
jgi:hypothetical protein